MRHYKKGRKLGTDSSHTKAIKKNLAVALFTNDRIKTTLTRAKEVRGTIDRIISWAKKGDLHSRRLAIAALGDKELVREVFEKAEQGMWADRNGGYTRILKLGPRKGDNAPMAILELVEEAVVPKGKKDEKPAKGKKSAAKGKKAEAKQAETLEEKADSNKLDQTPDENIEETGEEATESLADGGIQHENGAEGIDDVEEFAGGEEALTEEVATDHEREADLEAERAKEEEAIEDAGLEREKAKIEKAEAENIEKIKEETAKEEAELLEAVDPVMKDEGDFAEAVEETAKEEA